MISGLTDLVIDPLEIFTRAARASKTKAYSGQPVHFLNVRLQADSSGIQQVVQGNVPKPCGSVENDSELNLSGAPLLIHSMMRQVPDRDSASVGPG
ncbi:Aggrecan core protein [Trichinella spiralis]|uniref:Aggrecan core protein n=1 Tax=Trichinella spiralis TaxID=6334 RepID=A0ABR3KQH1_TRISP